MTNSRKGSIETIAKFFLKEYHEDYKLDFEKDISTIQSSGCFLLKKYNKQGQIHILYLICPIDRLVAETSQPFYEKILKYFENVDTVPSNNFWMGYVEVDDFFMPLKAQRFQIPSDFLK